MSDEFKEIDLSLPVDTHNLYEGDAEDTREVEEMENELDAALESIGKLEQISNDIIENGGITRRQALALESISGSLIPEQCPINSYTLAPTSTNLTVTMERININKDHIKAGIITIIVGAIAKLLHWIWKRIRGVSGKAELVADAAKETKAAADGADKALRTMESGGREPLGPVKQGEDFKEVEKSVMATVINAPRLSQELLKGLSSRQAVRVLRERRELAYLNTFKETYTRIIDDILSAPGDWLNFLQKMIQVMDERLKKHKQAFETYDAYFERAAKVIQAEKDRILSEIKKGDLEEHAEIQQREIKLIADKWAQFQEGLGDSTGVKGSPGYSELASTTYHKMGGGRFRYYPAPLDQGLLNEIIKKTDMIRPDREDTPGNIMQAAANSLMEGSGVNVMKITTVNIKAVETVIDKVDQKAFEISRLVSDIEALSEKIVESDKVRNHGLSQSLGESKLFRDYLKDLQDDIKATNGMARIYVRITDELSEILRNASTANGKFVSETRAVFDYAIKHSSWWSEDKSRSKKLQKAADELGEKLGALERAISTWRQRSGEFAAELKRDNEKSEVDFVV